MVAGCRELVHRKEQLIAEVGFEPTTSGPEPCRFCRTRKNNSARFVGLRDRCRKYQRKKMVAGVGFERTTSGPEPCPFCRARKKKSARFVGLRDTCRKYRRKKMVAGVGFEPTTSGPEPCRFCRTRKKSQPGLSGSGIHAGSTEERKWLRGLDLNQRPSGYEPDELPGCSTPHKHHNTHVRFFYRCPVAGLSLSFTDELFGSFTLRVNLTRLGILLRFPGAR